jgi:hypothetical protein
MGKLVEEWLRHRHEVHFASACRDMRGEAEQSAAEMIGAILIAMHHVVHLKGIEDAVDGCARQVQLAHQVADGEAAIAPLEMAQYVHHSIDHRDAMLDRRFAISRHEQNSEIGPLTSGPRRTYH